MAAKKPRPPRRQVRTRRFEQLEARLLLVGEIVINEIHYNPDVETQPVEFIELYNTSNTAMDLAGWRFSDGVDYTFPAPSVIAAHGYLVVTQNLAAFQSKFGVAAFGQYTGQLSNEGEALVLRDAAGFVADEVDYQLGFPWPTVGDPPGYSIELINPALDNNLGGSWRASTAGATQAQVLIAANSTWSYMKGLKEPSAPVTAWRELGYTMDPTDWQEGQAAIGYGETMIKTPLNDMQGLYTTVYLRKTFEVPDPAAIPNLILETQWDDGFNLWINGHPVTRQGTSSYELAYDQTASTTRENLGFYQNSIPPLSDFLQAGTNVVAVQLLNVSKSASSDAFFDLKLTVAASASGNGPTPGWINAVYAANAPPQVRQVEHSPQEPASGQPVTITTKVTDPDGVAAVTVQYQTVDPGSYIALEDAAYQTNWTTVTMNDAGTDGDAVAGDGTYTVVLPASLQVHRRLVRYRITARDSGGRSITAPYADDPQPNFAYFVYDGVPSWSGAIQPGSTDPARSQVVTYGSDVMDKLPVYQLITKNASVMAAEGWGYSQYLGEAYPWSGTLVYDGQVYDDIHFRARGGVWRYAMGKNMWKFDFNNGHSFQARDDYGKKYDTAWSKLNLGACIQQGDYGYRGEQGMFESVGFRLMNLAGVPASKTNFAEFRVIDGAAEAGPTQYDGDFWGLYLAVEQQDGRFLQEHDLPDGNLYKMDAGTGELNNLGPAGPANKSDLNAFLNTYNGTNPTDQWWRNNLNLEEYYSYRTIVEAIHHYDIDQPPGKNYFYYLNPATNQWSVFPWDLDLTWATTMYGGGNEPFKSRVLPRAAFSVEYKNRMRELRDLLFNTDQAYQLIDEMAAKIDDPRGMPSMVDADRAMWDYNPIMASSWVNPSKSGQGRFYQVTATHDFPGMVQLMKNWVTSRGSYLDSLASDSLIPKRPTVISTNPASLPLNHLTFRSSAFSSGNSTFAAIEWRVAEVTDPTNPLYDPADPKHYEINANWESGELTTFAADVTVPAGAVQVGHTYRVRVRMKDVNGRWSNWSVPTQFVPGPSDNPLKNALRITEVMYHPAAPAPGGPYVADDFEFVELANLSAQTVDLADIQLGGGISFSFAGGRITSLTPGQRVVVVANETAFSTRYDTAGMLVAGQYLGRLSNAGEVLSLIGPMGEVLAEFTYKDTWLPATDGGGFSLTVVDPSGDLALWNDKDGWRLSATTGGSPGVDDHGLPPHAVVVNELLSHTDQPSGDWIELYNTTAGPIDLSGWYLSDNGTDLTRYRIAVGTVLPAGGYLVLTQANQFGNAADPGARAPFGFSELGETAYLTSVDGAGNLAGYREEQDFGAADKEVPFGRYIKSTGNADFVAVQSATPGESNADPIVGPVVIDKIMYHPAANEDEYIELLNTSDQAVPLFDPANPATTWQLATGILCAFPQGLSIPAGGRMLVVPIDPDAYRTKYSVPAEVAIVGPYTGILDNAGEAVELYRPGTPEPDGFVPMVLAERIKYGNQAPWPVEPDGNGPSLVRLVPTRYGNDVSNWATSSVQIIVDNLDPGFAITSTWFQSPSIDPYADDSLVTPYSNATATWTPNLTEAGAYAVLAWWSAAKADGVYARDPAARYTVYYAGGSTVVTLNQTLATGQWVPLGIFNFNAGSTGRIVLSRVTTDSTKPMSADAMRFVKLDQTPPTVVGADVNDGAPHRAAIDTLTIQFSENVAASLGAGDLVLHNDTTGVAVDLSAVVPTYNVAANTAAWNLSGVALDDGNYTATLLAAGVTDAAGNPLDGDSNGTAGGDYTFAFFRLRCDTNGDRSVDIFDVAVLQPNYGQVGGMTPAQGDFDADGDVDIFDVAILQVAYGMTLPEPGAMPPAGAMPAAGVMPAAEPARSPAATGPDLVGAAGSAACASAEGARSIAQASQAGWLADAALAGQGESPSPRAAVRPRRAAGPATLSDHVARIATRRLAQRAAWEAAVDEVLDGAATSRRR